MSDTHAFKVHMEEPDSRIYHTDGRNLTTLSSLREYLNQQVMSEPFKLKYVDDDKDIILLESEEEFKEFKKWGKTQTSKGLLIRLTVERSIPENLMKKRRHENAFPELNSAASGENSRQENKGMKVDTTSALCYEMVNEAKLTELKEKIKSEVKEDILSEMKRIEETRPGWKCTGYDEDSDDNLTSHIDCRKLKFEKYEKKLEKEDKRHKAKMGHFLQKIEKRKMKLQEKVSRKVVSVAPPYLMSGLQSNETTTLAEPVTVGKDFVHVWKLLNDGTVKWVNVTLKHFWTLPSLESYSLCIQCPALLPGEEGEVAVEFKAPNTTGVFVSYWHLYDETNSKPRQFGHYVSVSGTIKPVQNEQQMLLSSAAEQTNRNFIQLETNAEAMKSAGNTYAISNYLASSVIAAEMAREAANVALRQANEKQEGAVSSTSNALDIKDMEKVTTGVSNLTVTDCSNVPQFNHDTSRSGNIDIIAATKSTNNDNTGKCTQCGVSKIYNTDSEHLPLNISHCIDERKPPHSWNIVDGAINVASTACSTARSALNNLRHKKGEDVEFDPVFENNMTLLFEMGFKDLGCNSMLLKQFNNDVDKVIEVICASGNQNSKNQD